jgi:hypothetical protein
MRWINHVASTGEMINSYKILFRKLKGRGYLEDLAIDMRIILKWILQK